ncbi:MAG: hypothetical protein D6738_12975 [Acidobacteria bacterium]|nr:MAG: hypothetical protein D6738_12975 [Acidobacteriota bacterium]
MIRPARTFLHLVCAGAVCAAAALAPPVAAGPPATRPADRAAVFAFDHDPLADPSVTLEGDPTGRLAWHDGAPAFPGDRPGALRAHFLSSAPTVRIGWALPDDLDERDAFTAFAAFEIRSEGFSADPDGFMQIAWGLWNAAATGLERVAYGPRADSFELLEFDWFPNVSPVFGGPYLSPALFGAADPENPLFPAAGAFANASFGFGPPVELPFDTPLLATMEHRPADGVVVVSVHELLDSGELLPVPGAVTLVPLAFLSRPEYRFDRIGIALYEDPFGGPTPAVDAQVDFHALGVRPGLTVHRADALFGAAGR